MPSTRSVGNDEVPGGLGLAGRPAAAFMTGSCEALHETSVLHMPARPASPDGGATVFPLNGQGGS